MTTGYTVGYATVASGIEALLECTELAELLKCRCCGRIVVRSVDASGPIANGYHACGNGLFGVQEQIAVNYAVLETTE